MVQQERIKKKTYKETCRLFNNPERGTNSSSRSSFESVTRRSLPNEIIIDGSTIPILDPGDLSNLVISLSPGSTLARLVDVVVVEVV
jgi:hypothetical protein